MVTMETKPGCKYQMENLDEKIEKQSDRIDNLEKNSIQWIRIATILETQTEANTKQSETLEKVNINLTSLNQSMKDLHNRVEDVESDLKQQAQTNQTIGDVVKQVDQVAERVGGIEEEMKQQTKNNSISIGEVFKKIFYVSIGIVVVAFFALIIK